MELSDYVRIFLRWWWLVLLGVIVAAASTFFFVRQQPSIYEAKATLMLSQVLEDRQATQADLWVAQNLAQTYVELGERRAIKDAVQNSLGLSWLPDYSITHVPNSLLLEVTATDSDPQRVAAVANEVANQLVRQGPSNPQQEDEERRQFVQRQLDDLEGNIDATRAKLAEAEEALAGAFSARQISDLQGQISALQEKLNDYQLSYGQLLAFREQRGPNTVSVVDSAIAPTEPVGPNVMRTVLLAAAVGLALAAGTAFLLEYLDDTVKTPEDVQKTTGVKALAGISRIPGDRYRDRLIAAKHPRSPISESYRVLRTSLQFSSLGTPLRSLVVTSPSPLEGKSTTAANLAVVMAQEGREVVLVDADLRRPVLHRIFQVGNKVGLSNLLLQEIPDLDGHLQPTIVENLRLLNTGPLPPNPSEILNSERMDTLIDYLKAEADVIIFDSPPSLTVTDALVLAAKTDGVLLVADSGRTRRRSAAEAAERFRGTGSRLLGVVLNRFRSRRSGYYYYHYYEDEGTRRRRRKREKQ